MPPKLKEKTPKKGNSNSPKKEKHPAGVEKLASSTKKLNITEPSLKSFSMVTLDGYMVKKYCQKFADFVEVDFHVAGVLPRIEPRWADHDLEEGDSSLLFRE